VCVWFDEENAAGRGGVEMTLPSSLVSAGADSPPSGCSQARTTKIKQEREKIQRPIQEINQNGKTKPGLDYAGVTPLSSRDRA